MKAFGNLIALIIGALTTLAAGGCVLAPAAWMFTAFFDPNPKAFNTAVSTYSPVVLIGLIFAVAGIKRMREALKSLDGERGLSRAERERFVDDTIEQHIRRLKAEDERKRHDNDRRG